MADEIQRLILEVQGQERVAALNAELAAERKALAELAAELRAGAITQQQFEQSARASAGAVLKLQDDIRSLTGRMPSGAGILQASYAVQDFTSVLAGDQGLSRALMAVQNNIPGLLMSLGVGGGLAGIISLVSVAIGALIPAIEGMWSSLDDDEAAGRAKERLRELQAQARETHKAFEALRNAPAEAEKLSAEGIGLFLRERPHADMARRAVAEGMTNAEAWARMTDDERKAFRESEADATADVDGALAAWRAAEEERIRRMGPVAQAQARSLMGANAEAERRRIEGRRDAAQARRAGLMRDARGRRAEEIVAGATMPGHEHEADRRRLLDLTRDRDGFGELQGYDPAKIAEAEAEYGRQQEADEEEAGRVREYRERRGKARAARERQQALEAQGLRNDRSMVRRLDRERQQAEARKQAEAKDAEADIHRRAREAERSAAEGRRTAARNAVIRQSQSAGYGTPDAAQADEMASQAIHNMEAGLDAQAAAWAAVMGKVRSMMAAAERFAAMQQSQQAQANALGMGADFSGQFSLLPPM